MTGMRKCTDDKSAVQVRGLAGSNIQCLAISILLITLFEHELIKDDLGIKVTKEILFSFATCVRSEAKISLNIFYREKFKLDTNECHSRLNLQLYFVP